MTDLSFSSFSMAMEMSVRKSRFRLFTGGRFNFIVTTPENNKCDVIRETPAYGGANSVAIDNNFPYIYIQRLFLNHAEWDKFV